MDDHDWRWEEEGHAMGREGKGDYPYSANFQPFTKIFGEGEKEGGGKERGRGGEEEGGGKGRGEGGGGEEERERRGGKGDGERRRRMGEGEEERKRNEEVEEMEEEKVGKLHKHKLL